MPAQVELVQHCSAALPVSGVLQPVVPCRAEMLRLASAFVVPQQRSHAARAERVHAIKVSEPNLHHGVMRLRKLALARLISSQLTPVPQRRRKSPPLLTETQASD